MSTIRKNILDLAQREVVGIHVLKRMIPVARKAQLQSELAVLVKEGKLRKLPGNGPSKYQQIGNGHAKTASESDISATAIKQTVGIQLSLPKNVRVDLTRAQAFEVVKQISAAFQ